MHLNPNAHTYPIPHPRWPQIVLLNTDPPARKGAHWLAAVCFGEEVDQDGNDPFLKAYIIGPHSKGISDGQPPGAAWQHASGTSPSLHIAWQADPLVTLF